MLGWVVSISASSSLTFFSESHTLLRIFSRMGADRMLNNFAARSSERSSAVMVRFFDFGIALAFMGDTCAGY